MLTYEMQKRFILRQKSLACIPSLFWRLRNFLNSLSSLICCLVRYRILERTSIPISLYLQTFIKRVSLFVSIFTMSSLLWLNFSIYRRTASFVEWIRPISCRLVSLMHLNASSNFVMFFSLKTFSSAFPGSSKQSMISYSNFSVLSNLCSSTIESKSLLINSKQALIT